MKNKSYGLLIAALLCILLPSCGSGGQSQSQPRSKTGTLIGADFGSVNKVHVMTIFSDGTISPVPGSPFAASGPPSAVAASASGLVFVAGDTGNFNGALSVFTISSNGALSLVGTPITSDIILPFTLSLTSRGDFLLVGNSGTSPVIFAVDTTTGSLSELGNLGVEGGSTFSPDGKFILSIGPTTLDSYSFNGATGATILKSSAFDFFETIPNPPVVHPSSKFVYVPYSSAMIQGGTPPPGGIAGFALAADGTLTDVPGSPFASGTDFASSTGSAFSAGVINPAGTYLYAESAGTVYGFAIDQNSGALTQIAGAVPFAGSSPVALAFDPSGQFLFVSQLGGIWSYSVSSDGVLKSVPGSPFSIGNEITSFVAVP